jgi:O-antigen ligase
MVLVTVGSGVASILTITRSAIVSACIAVALGVWLGYRRLSRARLRFLIVLVFGVVLALPFTVHSTVGQRFTEPDTVQGNSTAVHENNSRVAFESVVTHPLGRGLGANPATGLRNNTSNVIDAEDSYLQVGTELGLAAMLAFVGMYLSLLWQLRKAARIPGEHGRLAGAMWMVGGGLFVGGFFLHIWISLPIGLTFWGLAGIGISVLGQRRPDDELPAVASDADLETMAVVSI